VASTSNSTKLDTMASSARRSQQIFRERIIAGLLTLSGLFSILATVGIVTALFSESFGFFDQVSLREFFTSTRWAPVFAPPHFGVMPLVAGTVMIALGSALVAVPIGLASAIYLSEYAPDGVRKVVKPILEILAGIPTVVYGFFALTFVTPLLQQFIPSLDVFNALSALITVGMMTTPLVSSLSEDAMLAVPRSLREAAYALGATRFEVATKVVLPAAASGVTASVILAISRAVGETMIVAMAAGSTPKLTLNVTESIQTMTGFIAQIATGDVEAGSIAYRSLYVVGLLLFLMTLVMNILARFISERFREGEAR
jgi:phosphate transport system permease protein